jgi:hypothetical protein
MTTTCTYGPDSHGNRCGGPAVTTFTGSDGTVYGECVDHAPAAPVAVKRPSRLTHPLTGRKVRSASSCRYHVIVDYGTRAFIGRRSDSLEVARKFASNLGSWAFVIDATTGEAV